MQPGYKNGQKNNWRRTVWNEIADRVENRRDAVVVYWPGPRDLDRPEAIRRGFRASNLIGIDTDETIVQARRAAGAIMIHGDLQSVVGSWPATRPIAVIAADLCSCLSFNVTALLGIIRWQPAAAGGVIALNLQRGRERGATAAAIAEFTATHDRGVTHRGHYAAGVNCAAFVRERSQLLGKIGLSTEAAELLSPQGFDRECSALWAKQKPRIFPPYRSGRVLMDSVVFNWIGYPVAPKTPAGRRAFAARLDGSPFENMRRYVAAALALSTMGKGGK